MTIAITGSSGLIGSALVSRLREAGHEVLRMVRTPTDAPDAVFWNPREGRIAVDALAGVDCVVHLAGASIAKRWTVQQKQRIRKSRRDGTRQLSLALANMPSPPAVLIAASAIGYYGDRGDNTVDETSEPGKGFLTDVVVEWERATEPARTAGIRVVNLRLGLVLSTDGGALPRMLTPFRLGIGGPIGSGRQYMSWITLDDALAAIRFAINTETLHGPANTVTPYPVTNREFTKTLGQVLHRPTLLPLPAAAVRLIMGEMGDALLLSSTRVMPKKLISTGFTFRHPRLKAGFEHLLQD